MPETETGTRDYRGWLTLREIDESCGLSKGNAFRAFKRQLGQLREGEDFIVLDHQHDAVLAAQLHATNRLYRSSINPVFLSPAAAGAVKARLDSQKPQP